MNVLSINEKQNIKRSSKEIFSSKSQREISFIDSKQIINEKRIVESMIKQWILSKIELSSNGFNKEQKKDTELNPIANKVQILNIESGEMKIKLEKINKIGIETQIQNLEINELLSKKIELNNKDSEPIKVCFNDLINIYNMKNRSSVYTQTLLSNFEKEINNEFNKLDSDLESNVNVPSKISSKYKGKMDYRNLKKKTKNMNLPSISIFSPFDDDLQMHDNKSKKASKKVRNISHFLLLADNKIGTTKQNVNEKQETKKYFIKIVNSNQRPVPLSPHKPRSLIESKNRCNIK